MIALSQNDEKRLRLFLEQLQELSTSPLVQKESLSTSLDVSSYGEQQVVLNFDGFGDSDFRAFITTFHQFSMPSEEAVYIKKVANIILIHCDRGP